MRTKYENTQKYIRHRVESAFSQGYEAGVKKNKQSFIVGILIGAALTGIVGTVITIIL